MKIAVPDLISNSYFPAVAAVKLGFFEEEGCDVELELVFPVDRAYRALATGEIDFVAGSAHSALAAFPQWGGVKLLCAQAQGMYWFLVMRADLAASRGDVACVKGRSIGAAPWVDMGLRALLEESGLNLVKDDIRISPVPGASGAGINFGVTAARALENGLIDGFWANGMAAALALKSGAGTIVLDVRRGDGPRACFNYTMPTVASTAKLVEEKPEIAAAAVRAIAKAQAALRGNVALATEVGKKLFPATEAMLIAELVRRDLPFYNTSISEAFVADMNRFANRMGVLSGDVPYEAVVATELQPLWTGLHA